MDFTLILYLKSYSINILRLTEFPVNFVEHAEVFGYVELLNIFVKIDLLLIVILHVLALLLDVIIGLLDQFLLVEVF